MAHIAVICRSTASIDEDYTFQTYDECNTMLCEHSQHIGHHYQGALRAALVLLRDDCARAIESGVAIEKPLLARRMLGIVRASMGV